MLAKYARKLTVSCVFLCLPSVCLHAADIEIKASVDKNTITIGDVLNYTVTFISSEPVKIIPAEETKELGFWVVRDVKSPAQDSPNTQNINYLLATFSTGTITIPEISFKYTDKDGRQNEIKSSSASVSVESVMEKIGDKGDILDLKPPWAIRMPLAYYLTILLAVLAAAAGLYIWHKKYKKRTSPETDLPAGPAELPYEKAMRKLASLKDSGLISEGRTKEFYIALFDIVREFLSGMYGIETLERTTSEIYKELKRAEKDKMILGQLKDLFDECDMVKFAKYRPDDKTGMSDLETAKNIIENIDKNKNITPEGN